ncbi:serpentine type 7TM GPCR chemoreceptor srh domain-containing protein [Ditylenchus destructor]|uniref:Serpentine type 7TM GPCR chemoreceptor srh domain-containing protein n=1 Tax=Ditylenchus destructor TaxID=166010 RepID=A0AAD4NL83_9BILA|nr:serpentine type 7TM GPCR chemoreceptor srh domain-containing protein [Ditylenchus destructor]
MWTCLTKSPPAMSGYKWWLVMNATTSLFVELLYGLTMTEPLIPYPMLLIGGIFRNVILSDFFLAVYLDIFFIIIILTCYSNTLLFVYRYCQTINNYLYRRVFCDISSSVISTLIPFVVLCVLIITPLHWNIASRNDLIHSMKMVDLAVYEKIKNRSVVGVLREASEMSLMFAAVIFLLAVVTFSAIISLSIFGCYRFLYVNKDKFGRYTLSLYLTLMHSLVIEMLIVILIVVFPSFACILAFALDSPYGAIMCLIMLRLAVQSCNYSQIATTNDM